MEIIVEIVPHVLTHRLLMLYVYYTFTIISGDSYLFSSFAVAASIGRRRRGLVPPAAAAAVTVGGGGLAAPRARRKPSDGH